MMLAASPVKAQPSPGTPTPYRILVVDDDEHVAKYLDLCFFNQGGKIEITQTVDGRTGIALFKVSPENFGMVILDYVLKPGDIDGEDVYNAMRELSPTAKIIMISGFSTNPSDKLMEKGLDGYVKKPINLNALYKIMNRLLPGWSPKSLAKHGLDK